MFEDALIFVAIMAVAVVIALLWKIGPPWEWRAYFATETRRGILRGIILAPALILLVALVLSFLPQRSYAGDWLTAASVYAGLDQTRKLSPMCDASLVDDRLTSNMGFRVGAWRSESRRVRVNARYTHHSCAIGSDDRQYDALGVEVEWRVWER
jgi:hypothetical protein